MDLNVDASRGGGKKRECEKGEGKKEREGGEEERGGKMYFKVSS